MVRTLTLLDTIGYSRFPGKIFCRSVGTDAYEGAIEIRENNEVGLLNGVWNEGPRITFHWANRAVQNFGLLADGNLHRHGNKIWDAGNDGAGSGLDADLLDGKQGNAYMSLERLNINANDYTSIGVWESNTYSNMPTLNNWHQLMNWGTADSNYAFQMVNTYTTDEYLYFRHKIAGSWKNWRVVMDKRYITRKSDYQYIVLLLWRDADQTTHQVVGKIYTQDGGAFRFQLADVNLWHSRWGPLDSHKNTLCQIDTTGYPLAEFTLVTCTYNGEKWWALRHTNDQAVDFYFQGYSSRKVSFEKVIYYTKNTSTINNSEIYNSIVDQSQNLISRYTAGYPYVTSREVYQKSEADNRYVNVTGDTMSGRLILNGGLNTFDIEIRAAIPYIDFHYNNSTADYTSRIIESASGRLSIYGKLAVGTTGAVHDSYALSATSFYSSGNLTVNGVSTLSGTVNTNAINSSRILNTNGIDAKYFYLTTSSYGYNVNNTTWTDTHDGAPWYGMGGNTSKVWLSGYLSVSMKCSSAEFNLSGSTGRLTGNFVATGEVTAYTTSDMRLKQNISTLSYKKAISILTLIRPVSFRWNSTAFMLNNKRYKGIELGVIAQEVKGVLPCAIKEVFEHYMSVDYTKLIPPIIAVVNEHEMEIKRLKTKIKELEMKK